jgi:hypothetical protein
MRVLSEAERVPDPTILGRQRRYVSSRPRSPRLGTREIGWFFCGARGGIRADNQVAFRGNRAGLRVVWRDACARGTSACNRTSLIAAEPRGRWRARFARELARRKNPSFSRKHPSVHGRGSRTRSAKREDLESSQSARREWCGLDEHESSSRGCCFGTFERRQSFAPNGCARFFNPASRRTHDSLSRTEMRSPCDESSQ